MPLMDAPAHGLLWALLPYLAPALFAAARLATGKYPFSLLTSLACAYLSARRAPVLAAALVLFAAGDGFMAHRGNRDELFLAGIAGFFCAHAVMIAHALGRVRALPEGPRPLWPVVVLVALAAFYAPYLARRVLGAVPSALKAPVLLYATISLAGFFCALLTQNPLYAAGIALLLFSDTMIAEAEFVKNAAAAKWVLPTYYLCQILATMSAMWG